MLTTKEFLEEYICKAGETVVQMNDHEWEIKKETTYTFRTLGNIFAVESFDHHPPEQILKLKLTPKSRRKAFNLPQSLLQEGLAKGWFIEEVRFKKDGRTAESTVYRMGPGLFKYERLRLQKNQNEQLQLKETLRKASEEIRNVLPENFMKSLDEFQMKAQDQEGWGKERVAKFIHFLIAFLQLRKRQNRMDYKEIGATYYKEIGGSKAFDAYRKPFIGRLEKWSGAPIQELGVLSSGFITSVHFTGNLKGNFSTYSIGTVHSTNDIAIMEEDFHTDAHILWLVENRAVLTRMATETDFLKETNSFILGVDGQIGGAHRKLIRQLRTGSPIQKVMIWVDYDRSGTIIARDLVELIGQLPYKVIGNEENVFDSFDTYEVWMRTTSDAEQEMTLGGVENWRKWINP